MVGRGSWVGCRSAASSGRTASTVPPQRLHQPGDVIGAAGGGSLPVGEPRPLVVVMVVGGVDARYGAEVVAEVLDQVLDQGPAGSRWTSRPPGIRRGRL